MNMTLWKFKLTVKERERAVRRDGDVTRDGAPVTFLGAVADAKRMAEDMQHQLAARFPDEDVTVRAAQCESVGPYLATHLSRLAASAQDWKMIALHLAWCMAQNQARTEMQLNPNVHAIAEKIIEVARLQIRQELMQAQAGKPGVIVDPQGHPARA